MDTSRIGTGVQSTGASSVCGENGNCLLECKEVTIIHIDTDGDPISTSLVDVKKKLEPD